MKQLFLVLLFSFSSLSLPAQQSVDLNKLFGQSDEFLDVDDAFQLSVDVFDNELIASWKIAPEYYLYQHRFAATFKNATLEQPFLPDGKRKTDEYFGEVETYTKAVQISLPYQSNNDSFVVEIEFQGCADAGLCYPPTSRYFNIDRNNGSAEKIQQSDFEQVNAAQTARWTAPPLASATSQPSADSAANEQSSGTVSNQQNSSSKTDAEATQDKQAFVSEKDKIINTLNDSSVIIGFFSLVLLGIGLAFTPCVFPMMPIISSIIAGQGKNITTSKAFFLSLTYTQAMAIPYVIIGFIVAGVGASATATLQSPPFVIGAAVVFLLLSLGMFGFYEIQLPTSVQNKLNQVSQKQQSGTYIGAGIMGAISGAVVSPCVTIPLIAVLTWISQVGDSVTGAIYLYGLAVGMGIPLIMIGVGGGKLMPKAGNWMNAVKAVFGVLMIVVALYITKHLIPGQINLVLWGLLAIISATYMGALRQVEAGWPTLWKGVAIGLMVYGVVLIIGAAQGSQSLMKPLASTQSHSQPALTGNRVANTTEQQQNASIHDGFILIKTTDDLDKYLAQAKAENKTVMLDFFAEYCAACYEFAELTFPHPKVQQALANTILLQADVTEGDADDRALMERFKIFGLPSILFFDRNGNEITSLRAEGFEDAETFATRIDAAIGD
jgi:thiol:disulfide interchange protein DsbD